jgi:hypothetical protein
MLSLLKLYLGKMLNLAGYPALVRECEYHSHALNAAIRVKKLELFTLVSVNGIDVYFNRFTGTIDGVGANPGVGCMLGATQGSARFGEQPDTPELPAHTRTIEGASERRKDFAR